MALALGKFVWEIDRMSLSERQDWALYVEENGPLNPSIRMEAAIGRAVLPWLKRGTKLKDLMPWPREDVVKTPDAMAHALMSVFRAGGGRGGKVKYKVHRKHG